MIGAFIDGAYFKPKKKKVILIVIPKKLSKNKSDQSAFLTLKSLAQKGKSMRVAPKKRKKARVKGGIFWRASLKIGEAAPQMMLAKMRASMA